MSRKRRSRRLPTRSFAAAPPVEQTVSALIAGQNLEIGRLTPLEPVGFKDLYEKRPIEIIVLGDLSPVAALTVRIEKHVPLMTIDSLSLDRTDGVWRTGFVANGYVTIGELDRK